jgi:hypothetical protein
MPRLPVLTMTMLLCAADTVGADESPPVRVERSLSGAWEFRRDGTKENEWKSVTVPSIFQEHEGNDWHGVGWYRTTTDRISLRQGRRLFLHFDAAATLAEVWFDDKRLGDHLGGWTPFRFEVTEQVRGFVPGPHVIRVRLDEEVGHNTQGFLPIIEPHFGGLWQDVKLIDTPDRDIDELNLLAIGDPKTGEVTIDGPWTGIQDLNVIFRVRYRLVGSSEWITVDDRKLDGSIPDGVFRHRFKIPDFKLWSPEKPNLYEIDFSRGQYGFRCRAAFRTIEAKGRQLLLNGQPLIVRGVLNWGYYPPRLAPMIDRDRWRSDIRFVKSMGFNLMKFCLWIPPREFFDLCDEEGMLVWQEYPTWHPKLDQAHKAELIREYGEFFAYDRNHPGVILRSLTCETGASADLNVIRELYDLAKKQIPGCLVEDDSSWIEWNRVSDFFDDHPYGNNHTWVATIRRLRGYAEKHGPKPLLLGEAIAADTWVDPEPLLKKVGNDRPYWLPGFLDGNKKWLDRMRSVYGPGGLDRLGPDSLKYAMLMRQYQIETFRREAPESGYVVSVLRDFPLASMGLLDYNDRPKWPVEEWKWHVDPSQSEGVQTKIPGPSKQNPDVITARHLDDALLTKLEGGARVILLPGGEKGSFPLRDHWFLRGGLYLPDHPLWQKIPRDFMVMFQHTELGGRVIPDIQYFDEIDPVVLLWDNHDIKEVKTHALVFETRVGKGRLFVSTLDHSLLNELGQSILGVFKRHVSDGPMPTRSLKPETIRRMHERIKEKRIDLTKETWRFKPDPKNIGLAETWQKPDLKLDDSWSKIRVGKHWEAQGWPLLDGWAWYRLDLTIPADWADQQVYLSFEGVDDHYEAFVNGTKVGSGGDIATKRTAFDERASFKITGAVKPGEKCAIAVRVLDWGGAGGIHRPVTLGTAELGTGLDLLK